MAIAAISSRVVGVAVEEKIESVAARFGKDELRVLRLALRHGIGRLPVGGVQKNPSFDFDGKAARDCNHCVVRHSSES